MNVVDHTSRVFDVVINYPSSENNLVGSFTAKNDGEIFDAELTNIASYTIAGVAANLPISPMPIIGGTSYAVNIVKNTNGLPASIKLKTRRAVDASETISVVDYGFYDGRYYYALLNNNTLQKHDLSLKIPANYIGSGAWSVSSLVATINLPTFPTSGVFSYINFVKIGGVQRLFLCGFSSQTYNIFACYVDIATDTVWDLNLSTINGFTQIRSGGNMFANGVVSYYDYVRENIIVESGVGGNHGQTSFTFNLATKMFRNFTGVEGSFIGTNKKGYSYNPYNGRFFCGGWCVDFETGKVHTGVVNSAAGGSFFNRNNGKTYFQAYNNSLNALNAYNDDGTIASSQSIGGYLGAGFAQEMCFSSVKSIGLHGGSPSYGTNTYIMHNLVTAKGGAIGDIPSGMTWGSNPIVSDYNGLGIMQAANGTNLTRLFFFDYNLATPYFGYLDLPYTIVKGVCNQLIN